MGMYDTLNSEQVKCFPWYSFDVMSLTPAGSVGGQMVKKMIKAYEESMR